MDEKVSRSESITSGKGVTFPTRGHRRQKGPFVWKDTYLFLMGLDGKMIAHPIKPELIRQDNGVQVKDTDGKPRFVGFIQVAGNKGSGWVDDMRPKPGGENPVAKSSYFYRVPGTPYFVGAGIYKQPA